MLSAARRSIRRSVAVQLAGCFFALFVVAVPALVVATHHHEDGEEHFACQLCEYASAPASPAPLVLPPKPEVTCTRDTPEAVPTFVCVDAGRSPDAPRAPPVLLNS